MFQRTTGRVTPLSVIVATLLLLLVSFASAQQPPTLVLLNGDIDGDNEVTLLDHGLLTASFGLTEGDPDFNPNADLDGDGEVTLLDFGILVNNFGAIGADALTGVEQAMTEGLTIPVRVQLGNWGGHATRVLTMEFRAKRVGTESNPAAPVYVKVVETTAPTDVVEVELTLPAGACTVQAKANHWLRGEMAVVSSVPWIFAAPTGANKVTVYWDEVAGATGYRVRWGTVSGSYPHSSPVLPADARQWSITGLVTEQTYYVVVQAEYNGLWGPPSEEDSAVPHVGAIPWDSGDARSIMSRVRYVTNSAADRGMLDVIGPDERIYSDEGVRHSDPYFDLKSFSLITPQFGFETPLSRTVGDTLDSLAGGNEVLIELQLFPRNKLARLRLSVADPLSGHFFIREIAGTAQVASRPNGRFRRVHSIAQLEKAIKKLRRREQGYIRTGSFVSGMGVGFNVAQGGWLEPPAQLQDSILYMWNDWTAGSTVLQGSFPASGVVYWEELNPYSREIVSITLPFGD
jgi:hypothetical protein